MKKVLFLMLFLMVLGAASVKAQVRIGGNTAPSAAAVLDLNATDLTNNGTGGLTLPRVSLGALSGTSANLNGAAPLTGMLVYNTNVTLGVGVYFWSGSQWVLISGNGVVGNALMDTIAGGGLNKTGAGTAISPYKVGIRANGVTTGMIANNAVTLNKIFTQRSDSGSILRSNGTSWYTVWPGAEEDTSSISLTVNKNQPVTWVKILDTMIYFGARANTWVQITAPGILPTDFCNTIIGRGFTSNYTNVIIFSSVADIDAPLAWRPIKCYRPQ